MSILVAVLDMIGEAITKTEGHMDTGRCIVPVKLRPRSSGVGYRIPTGVGSNSQLSCPFQETLDNISLSEYSFK